MAKPDFTLTAERLRELVHYEPDTGIFIRKIPCFKAGERAGYKQKDGYLIVHTNGYAYRAHRLAWF